jgi:hypothetical protein
VQFICTLGINIKIYFYIITLLMVYLAPYIITLPNLILAEVGVVGVGSQLSETQAGGPIGYTDLTSAYWQEHFVCEGRIQK